MDSNKMYLWFILPCYWQLRSRHSIEKLHLWDQLGECVFVLFSSLKSILIISGRFVALHSGDGLCVSVFLCVSDQRNLILQHYCSDGMREIPMLYWCCRRALSIAEEWSCVMAFLQCCTQYRGEELGIITPPSPTTPEPLPTLDPSQPHYNIATHAYGISSHLHSFKFHFKLSLIPEHC